MLEGAEPQEVPAALRTAAVTRRTTGGPCWGAYLRVLLQNEPSSVHQAPGLASVGRRTCQREGAKLYPREPKLCPTSSISPPAADPRLTSVLWSFHLSGTSGKLVAE